MSRLLALALALPWVITPVVTVVRARRSRSLDAVVPMPEDAERTVSVVIPARDEAPSIGRCVRSVLASAHPRFEVIVVDDHSTDGTAAVVAAAAGDERRLRVVVPPPLPPGWFGKQWACHVGAEHATGELLVFLDADTWVAPDLLGRAVAAQRERGAALLTVAGTQEMETFWERLLQPQVFAVLAARFGGTECVNEARRVEQKIANGQFILITRAAYHAAGGHAAVRDRVAEDLALAQRFFALGHRTVVILGLVQLRTRMYRSLRALVEGWSKNIFVGGREAMPGGRAGRFLYPFLVLLPPLAGVVPPLVLALGARHGTGSTVLLWAALATGANLLWWLLVYASLRLSPLYAVLHPLGAVVFLHIVLVSLLRGSRVRWKGRLYRVA